MKFISILLTISLAVAANSQKIKIDVDADWVTKMVLKQAENLINQVLSNKKCDPDAENSLYLVCDAFRNSVALLNGAASVDGVDAGCVAMEATAQAQDLNIWVKLAKPNNTKCATLLQATCTDGQRKSTLTQVFDLLTCVVGDLGSTVSKTLKGTFESVGSRDDLLHVVQIILKVLLEKVNKVVCDIKLTKALPGIVALLVYVVLSLGAALVVALKAIGAVLFLILVLVLALVLGLSPVLGGVTGLVDAVTGTLRPLLLTVVSVLYKFLFNRPIEQVCKGAIEVPAGLQTLLDKLTGFFKF